MNKRIKIFIKQFFRIPANLEIYLIRFYQKHISSSLGRRCIFYPTCSEYVRQAVDKYGIIKGNVLGLKRILKCNPFSHGGVDYLK